MIKASTELDDKINFEICIAQNYKTGNLEPNNGQYIRSLLPPLPFVRSQQDKNKFSQPGAKILWKRSCQPTYMWYSSGDAEALGVEGDVNPT